MTETSCQAKTRRGEPCTNPANHEHVIRPIAVDDVPLTIRVCGVHLRTLLRRERLGTEATLIDRWNA